jgi:hypothetical protein
MNTLLTQSISCLKAQPLVACFGVDGKQVIAPAIKAEKQKQQALTILGWSASSFSLPW